MASGYSWNELVEMAIQVEKAGEGYYRRAAAETEGELRATLKALADAERQHGEVFHSLLPEGFGEGTKGIPPGEAEPYVKQFVGANLLRYLEDCRDINRQLGEAREILEFAVGFEEESIRFYTSLCGQSTKPEVVDKIIDEERKHLKTVRKMLDSLS
jgi:rubrerythrin